MTPNPPQLIRPSHDFVPEQLNTVFFALTPVPDWHEPSPLQVTAHSSPAQFMPLLQLFAPPQKIFVLGASLWMFHLHVSDPEHSTLQLSPPQLM